jgi:hypothetical protein
MERAPQKKKKEIRSAGARKKPALVTASFEAWAC